VTPPGGAEITIGTNLAFRTEQQAVTSLDTRTVAAGIGSLRACRLEISAAPDPSPSTTTVFALGDGADGSTASRELATYIRGQNPDRFFYLGDVYATGTADEFARNYDPAYGALADRTDPVIGNHEYANRNSGYYPYWQQRRGWTSEQAKHRSYVTPEGWQIIAYSSEHDPDAEAAWVSTQMATHPGTCRIVMAHRGRHVVADSEHGDNTSQQAIWSLIANKTAINLVGHNHLYGRLAPIDGVTVLVSGAGKAGLRSLGIQHHTVAASENRVPTATKLVLRRGAADFRQVDKNGTVYDSGTITCAVADPPPLTECLPSSPTPIDLRRWLDDAFLDDRFPGSNARIDEIPAGSAGDPVRRSMAAALARLQAGDLGGARASLDAVAAPPYSVACVDQEGLQRPLGLLWEPRTTDPPHGWGTAVWSFAGSREIFVEAPHPKADTDTEAMAITAFGHADARALSG
jgi:hypothetical protein